MVNDLGDSEQQQRWGMEHIQATYGHLGKPLGIAGCVNLPVVPRPTLALLERITDMEAAEAGTRAGRTFYVGFAAARLARPVEETIAEADRQITLIKRTRRMAV